MLYWSWQISSVLPEMHFNKDASQGLPQCHKLLLSFWPMQDQVSESNHSQLCQSHHVEIIVILGHDESHPRICFLWLHIVLEICAVAFCFFFCFQSSFLSEPVGFESFRCHPCTAFIVAFENHNSNIYSIYHLLAFKPLVASISFCVKRMIANMLPTFLCDSGSNVAWAHPTLTYLMAGFWWRPVAQIEKFPIAKWNVWLRPPVQKNWGLFYFNSKFNFRQSGFLYHLLCPACRHFSCQDIGWMGEY